VTKQINAGHCQCCGFGDLLLKTPYLKLAELARAADHTSAGAAAATLAFAANRNR
jgi:hypothetical protein